MQDINGHGFFKPLLTEKQMHYTIQVRSVWYTPFKIALNSRDEGERLTQKLHNVLHVRWNNILLGSMPLLPYILVRFGKVVAPPHF